MTRRPSALTALAACAALAALAGTVQARQPVTSPVYYLTTAPALAPGVTLRGVLTAESGRNFKDGSHLDVFVLRGTAGTSVEITASSTAFDTYLTLFAPDGTVVARDDDDWGRGGTDSAVRTTLPASGTYVVVVSGFGPADLGPYTVAMQETSPVGGARVALGDVVAGALAPEGRAVHELVLEEGAYVGVDVRSGEFDTYLELQTADGFFVAGNDDVGLGTDSGLVTWLEPGTYHVVVTSFGGWGGGAYELELARYERVR